MRDPDFQADLARYPARSFFREQSLWAIYIYRFGRRTLNRNPGFFRNLALKRYWIYHRIIETVTGVSLPLGAEIGPGLRIYHFGNIFVHNTAKIGANCTLRHGVTIGNRVFKGPAPIIEDNVELGAYAQVLGGIRIGQGAKIGAMSVVLKDVPAGATAVGIPAKVLTPKVESEKDAQG